MPNEVDSSMVCASSDTPRKAALKRKLFDVQSKLCSYRKKIKLLQQSKRSLAKKNANLKSVIKDLQQNNLLATESLNILENCAGGIEDLLKR